MHQKPPVHLPLTPNSPKQSRAEALKSVNLAHNAGGNPNNPALSVSAVNAFKAQAAQARTPKEETEDKLPMEELEPVEAPKLTDEQLAQAEEMDRILSAHQAIDVAEATRNLESRQKEVARLKQIEEALDPISLADLLYDGSCSQRVPVCEEYSLTFDMPPGEVDLYIADISQEYVEKFERAGKQPLSLNWINRVASMACSLTYIGDTPTPAVALLNALRTDSSLAENEVKKRIYKLLVDMLKRPTPLLQLWVQHHTLFVLRVRHTLNHAGYVEYQAGK